MSRDPTTGILYAIVRTTNLGGSRGLATIDLGAGTATLIGDLGDSFASIAFEEDGTLWGVGGDGAGGVSETLCSIDKATAVATSVLALGNGNDGEAIGVNYDDGLLYHYSGFAGGWIFESVDLGTLTVTPISLSGDSHTEATSLVWDPSRDAFLHGDIDGDISMITTGGVRTTGLTAVGFAARGLSFKR